MPDILKADSKALVVQYAFGKAAFVLFRKGQVTPSAFRERAQERHRDICVQKMDISDEEGRNKLYFYDSTLIQLPANSVHVPVNDLFPIMPSRETLISVECRYIPRVKFP